MSTRTVHTFDVSDVRARLTWHGATYRAVRIERDDTDARWNTGLSVWVVRTTKKGTDYKRPNSYMWLTLTNSLDKVADGKELAAYVRELTSN